MPWRRRQDGLLAKVNFPPYTLQMLTSRHVVVGGGGGSSNTGVANGFVRPAVCFSSLLPGASGVFGAYCVRVKNVDKFVVIRVLT